MKNLIKFLLVTLFFTNALNAQNKLTKGQIDSLPNTIENQFLKTFSKGKRWNEFKMIKKTDFLGLQKRILDSVTKYKGTIVSKNNMLAEKEASINTLKSNIVLLEETVVDARAKENSISMLGFPIKKQLYNSILWGIIGLLSLGIAFFIYRYKNNIKSTKESKSNFLELEEEFESFRKKTIEKEQKLRRQLHDEINKNKG